MSQEIELFIRQLEFRPGAPEWRGLTKAEQTLAAFATLMADHGADGLINVAFCYERDEYCSALNEIGAGWLAVELKRFADLDPDSEAALENLRNCDVRVQAEYQRLWRAAIEFAEREIPSARWQVD